MRDAAGRRRSLLLIAIVAVSDSAQYYTGRAFGRRKLAPAISPKKTVEGAIGGLVVGRARRRRRRLAWIPGCAARRRRARSALLRRALGIVGDLFESLLKRSAGVKDSSALIPGTAACSIASTLLFAAPVLSTSFLQVRSREAHRDSRLDRIDRPERARRRRRASRSAAGRRAGRRRERRAAGRAGRAVPAARRRRWRPAAALDELRAPARAAASPHVVGVGPEGLRRGRDASRRRHRALRLVGHGRPRGRARGDRGRQDASRSPTRKCS